MPGRVPLPSRLRRQLVGLNLSRLPWRPARRLAGIAAIVAVGIGLAGCANSGESLARQACGHVNRSIAFLKEASHESSQARASSLEEDAEAELRTALPIAAEAAYDDGQWQALMTTLSESNRVAPTMLVPALTQQCAQAESGPFNQPAPPDSIPPPAPSNSSS